ncbi:Versatile peroxidase [Paramyrothecium foliicola]|nr:Versatile peroxidase [Paramyrothecium foliicola]
MRSFPLLSAALLAGIDAVMAYPGMGQQMDEIMRIKERQQTPELLGDLLTLSDSELTPTATEIKNILLNQAPGQHHNIAYETPVPAKDTQACAEDTCCIWKYIADEMAASMVGSALRCNNLARASVRLGFHDAGAWSKSTGPYGGADGSIVLARECEDRIDNNGLQGVCAQMRAWHGNWKKYGISMADLIQMAANVATVVCPNGPRVRTFVGRRDNANPAPTGLLPHVNDSVDKLLALFADKTISSFQLVALVGAHTTSQQRFVDQSRAGDPQDRTPGLWDLNFYGETRNPNSPARVFKFKSDLALASDPRTSRDWDLFVRPGPAWNGAYARAYVRVSLLGVPNINELVECTKVLPFPNANFFPTPDDVELDDFLNGPRNEEASDALMRGDLLPGFHE